MTRSTAFELMRLACLREAEHWVTSVLWSKRHGMVYAASAQFAADFAAAALVANSKLPR